MGKKLLLVLVLLGMFVTGGLQAQYFYFDSGTTSFPYQQGCSESVYVRVNTESHAYGATAGLLRLSLNSGEYLYSNSPVATTLQTALFVGSTNTFNVWTAPTGSPSWITPYSIVQMDRNNGATLYKGANGLYGTFLFTPLYNPAQVGGNVSIVYDGDTTKTVLSYGGSNIINSTSQNSRLTGTYVFLQQPCIADEQSPNASSITLPTAGTKRSYLSGMTVTLADNAGVNGLSNVPFVWSGGVWTGNVGGTISNQYGIDPSTFVLHVSGNGQTRNFTQADNVLVTGTQKTWQDTISNYTALINPVALFDYGIEKTITVTGSVADRAGNLYTLSSLSFNAPVAPSLISNSPSPVNGAIFVNLSTPVKFSLQDDWAGVNTATIQVTLQGINGTTYGPYIYSGTDLNLSGLAGVANAPDQAITINHSSFPTSGTIQVSVNVSDLEGTPFSTSWSFATRPACAELQCCNPIALQTGNNLPFVYGNSIVNISGGINPYLTGDVGLNGTGYLMCGTENAGLSIYSGTDISGQFLSFFEGSQIVVSGVNVVALLTGTNNDTLLLIRLGNYIIKVYPGNRQGTNYTNLGELRFYSQAKALIASGSLATALNGTGDFLFNVPSGTYYVVYKGQSHLASYLSGVAVVQGQPLSLDFTTGTNLYNVQNKNESQNDGYKYQIAGDMKSPITFKYDFVVNGNDVSSLVYGSGSNEVPSTILDPKNLNGDTVINGADIGIIGINYLLTDPFTSSSTFTW